MTYAYGSTVIEIVRQKEFCRYLGCFCRIRTVALWIIFVAKLGCCVPSLNACDVVLANTREMRAKLGGVLSEVDVVGSDPDRAMGPTSMSRIKTSRDLRWSY